MFKKKPEIQQIQLPKMSVELVPAEQFEEELARQKIINSCLLEIITDITNHKREQNILKKIDDLKNFMDRVNKA